VNSHRAARQIWMAAERTAWHFDLEGDRWVAKKTNEELSAMLEAVLSKRAGKAVKLR
jgi:CyaY protein